MLLAAACGSGDDSGGAEPKVRPVKTSTTAGAAGAAPKSTRGDDGGVPFGDDDDDDDFGGAAGAPQTKPPAAGSGGSPTTAQAGAPASPPPPPASGGSAQDTAGAPAASTDPFASARALCLTTINSYRSTLGLPAYGEWTAGESCADSSADSDATTMEAHGAYLSGQTCGANAQAECPMYGPDITDGLPECLGDMWSEKDRPQCAGCDSCDAPFQNCNGCTFFGTDGSDGCGHYLSMKSSLFSEVACGFSNGGWYLQNYQ